jgi:hypothetical protein
MNDIVGKLEKEKALNPLFWYSGYLIRSTRTLCGSTSLNSTPRTLWFLNAASCGESTRRD